MNCCRDEILCRSYRRKIENDVRSVQSIGMGFDVVVSRLELDPHGREACDVHVDRSSTEIVTAGKVEPNASSAGE
jgi:hypothetical protein